MPVGLVEAAEFAVVELRLAVADKILIYSDGVTETRNLEKQVFCKRRLREVAEARAGHSCSDIYDAIQDAFAAFIEGAAQSGDITLVVLEFGGKEGGSRDALGRDCHQRLSEHCWFHRFLFVHVVQHGVALARARDYLQAYPRTGTK